MKQEKFSFTLNDRLIDAHLGQRSTLAKAGGNPLPTSINEARDFCFAS